MVLTSLYANFCAYDLHTKVDIIGKSCKLSEKKICQNTLNNNDLRNIGKYQKRLENSL